MSKSLAESPFSSGRLPARYSSSQSRSCKSGQEKTGSDRKIAENRSSRSPLSACSSSVRTAPGLRSCWSRGSCPCHSPGTAAPQDPESSRSCRRRADREAHPRTCSIETCSVSGCFRNGTGRGPLWFSGSISEWSTLPVGTRTGSCGARIPGTWELSVRSGKEFFSPAYSRWWYYAPSWVWLTWEPVLGRSSRLWDWGREIIIFKNFSIFRSCFWIQWIESEKTLWRIF